jgi:hypothetical protein
MPPWTSFAPSYTCEDLHPDALFLPCREPEFAGRLNHVRGDFFKPLPQEAQGADVVTLKVSGWVAPPSISVSAVLHGLQACWKEVSTKELASGGAQMSLCY